MSGWIKYSTNLHNKPRVQRIADELKISRFDAAGRLCAVWVWADTMTQDGVIEFGTLAQVDRAAETKGFGEAMIRVGWLRQDGDNLVIPDWELHHSASAKRRSDGAKRAAKLRHEKAEKTTKESGKSSKRARRAHEGVRDVRTKSAPRGEERREEKSAEAIASAPSSPPAEAAAEHLTSDSVTPEGGGERITGGAMTEHLSTFVRSIGWDRQDYRDLDALQVECWQIQLGRYPEIGEHEQRDPLAYLRPRLTRYWLDRAAEREENPSLKPPSLRKTLEDGRWRIDPNASTARVSVPEAKPIRPEYARQLERLNAKRSAS